MKNPLSTRLSLGMLALFGGFVFFALQANSYGAETRPERFVCAARIECGGKALPSTQDLPTERTPTVLSRSVEDARAKCMTDHTRAYSRLARNADETTSANAFSAARGCKIVSEAFRE